MRKIVWEILVEVFVNRQYSNLLLRKRLEDLSDVDKGLATTIVYGTIQNYRYLNYQFSGLVKANLDKEISVLLMMSIYQFYFLDKVPDYSVVDEAVKIAKDYKQGGYKNLVNAVLRNVLRQKELKSDDLGIKYSFPSYLVKMFESQYGREKTIEILENSNKPSSINLRYNPLKISDSELLKDPKMSLVNRMQVKYDGNILKTLYLKKGQIVIQDESSQEVAYFVEPSKNDRIYDMCAAPGTKTSQIAALMENQGEIIAGDVHQHRVELMDGAFERLGIKNVKTMMLDGTKAVEQFGEKYFDKVLIDAPCSGLGVLRRKPEIKVFINPKNIDELVSIQAQLLEVGSKLVKDGGYLIYSTCTLNTKENQRQLSNFLEKHPEYIMEKEKEIIIGDNDGDGFYIARLKRV